MLRTFLYLLPLLVSAYSIIPNHFHFSEHLRNKDISFTDSDISVNTAFYNQKLDPFSRRKSKTFQQRYFYTEQFSLNKKTAFLYVSGPDDFNVALFENGNPIIKAAKQFGANVFALEHRFYGMSKPDFETIDSSNLQYLSTFRAIQDVISFIEYANAQFNMDPDVRWVLWGSGYGGIIAAEARKWDPITVAGVVASSAPIKRELDFWQYNDRVERAISGIGGAKCYQKIKEGFKEIQNSMNTLEGRAEISDLFELDPPLNDRNLTYNEIQMFYLSIIAPFQQIVQFNNQFNLSIKDMCDVIDQSWDNIQAIHQAYVYLSLKLTGTIQPMVSSYEQFIDNFSDGMKESIDRRHWQYQICTEFGWFFTTNNHESGLFGAVVPTSLFINQCFDLFPEYYKDSNATKIRDDIEESRKFYGKYSGTNAVFINGEMDPWISLGKTSSEEFSVVAFTIPMGSHSNDFSDEDSENEYIQQAHELIIESINEWVNGPKNPTTFVDTLEPWTRPKTGVISKKFHRKLPKQENHARFSKLADDVPSKQNHLNSRENIETQFLGMMPIAKSFYMEQEEESYNRTGFEVKAFRQRVDHFDNTNPSFFQQKYYKSTRFAKIGGPNFLKIGGEGSAREDTLLSDKRDIMRIAKKFGATVYLLEHRFYGDSLVGNNTDLKKLSSLQMLYDIAEFIKAVNIKTGTSDPWITFGGSYSGALSAWMREIFPELVIGAIASSAPVLAKTDFYEYRMVVEKAYQRYNPLCYEAIKNGFETIHTMFQTERGRQDLSDIFRLSSPFGKNVSQLDKHYFFIKIQFPFQYAVQYSGDGSGAFTEDSFIAIICNQMTNTSNSDIQNIAYMRNKDRMLANNYTLYVNRVKHEKKDSLLWSWQTCTEFGYFQSIDSGKSIFGASTPVSFEIQLCMDLFGEDFTRAKVDGFIEKTNYKYGGIDGFRGTNVVFTNGNADPWHALGLYKPTDKSVVSYLIDGTSHCVDMNKGSYYDVPGLKIARKLIDDNIKLWLKQAERARPTVKIESTTTVTTKRPIETTTKSTVLYNLYMPIICLLISYFV